MASKNIYKITCPTNDTYKDMLKFKFLNNKLCVLNDPINIGYMFGNIKLLDYLKKDDVFEVDTMNRLINDIYFDCLNKENQDLAGW